MAEDERGQDQGDARDDGEAMARLQEEINKLPVSEHVAFMMHSLSSLAVERMGLVGEGAGRKDLGQARLAIDAFKALLGVLEQAIPIAEVTAHRGVLSQLQFAYVGALEGSKSAGEEAPAGQEAALGQEAPAEEPPPTAEPEAPKKAAKPRANTGGAKATKGGKQAS